MVSTNVSVKVVKADVAPVRTSVARAVRVVEAVEPSLVPSESLLVKKIVGV